MCLMGCGRYTSISDRQEGELEEVSDKQDKLLRVLRRVHEPDGGLEVFSA
jgi:hypothetical protein